MASSDGNFGIDLLLESQKGNIRNESDVLVILCHWILCKNNLRNVGVGTNTEVTPDDRASELLPEGWNAGESYKLRYVLDKKLYIFTGSDIEGSLLINLLEKSTLKTVGLVIDTEKAVKSKTGATLSDFVNDSEALIKRITEEVVSPMIKKPEEARPDREAERPSNPLRVDDNRSRLPYPYQPGYPNPFGPDIRDPLRDIGRGDLDPFGQGGGMILPPGHNRQPPFGIPRPPFGNVPPGARYDPPNPFGRLDPDNDHFRPPGNAPPGYDDMFM